MGLHVEVKGSGPHLVLLHGWGMNASIWDGMVEQLAPHFTVHAVDLPGHGSSVACVPYTLDAIADALHVAMPPRAVICGWSLGGQLALVWALRYPAQAVRLVLIATTPRFVRAADWTHGIDSVVVDAFARDLAADSDVALQRFCALQAMGGVDTRVVLRHLRERMSTRGEIHGESLGPALEILRNTDLRASLADVVQPALLVHGERDTMVPLAAGAYCQRMMPNARLEAIADAAHAPFFPRPQHVARCIMEFCLES